MNKDIILDEIENQVSDAKELLSEVLDYFYDDEHGSNIVEALVILKKLSDDLKLKK